MGLVTQSNCGQGAMKQFRAMMRGMHSVPIGHASGVQTVATQLYVLIPVVAKTL